MIRLYLILSLSLLYFQSFGQEWYPVGATWHLGWAEHGCVNPFVSHYYSDKYVVEKDTIVLGKPCKKIVREANVNSYGRTISYVFDSAGKVYYYPPYEFDSTRLEWSLLFDFTKEKGDTIWYPNMVRYDYDSGHAITYYNVVDTVFDRIINNDTLKAYWATPIWLTNFSTPWGWVSLGTTTTEVLSGPFYVGGHFSGGCTYPQGLRCYSDSNIGFYKNYHLDCDTSYSITTSLEEENSYSNYLLYPNPAKDELKIELKKSIDQSYMKIFDLNGEEIISTTLKYRINRVDLSMFSSGIYFYEIESEEGVFRDKLIIQK